MTARHRYVGKGEDLVALCGANFGGVTYCGLPFFNNWHYNDEDHPFTPSTKHPDECGWALQDTASPGLDRTCAGDVADYMHNQLLPAPITTPLEVTVTMEYPVQEPPAGWREAHVYPPSDDGGAAEPVTERLNVAAPAYTASGRRLNPDGTLPEDEGDSQQNLVEPEWKLAVEVLVSDDKGLVYGPWPLRRFLLTDGSLFPGSGQRAERDMCLKSLEELGMDYSVVVYRPQGKPWRLAWVTWDWALGLTVETACDELAAYYG